MNKVGQQYSDWRTSMAILMSPKWHLYGDQWTNLIFSPFHPHGTHHRITYDVLCFNKMYGLKVDKIALNMWLKLKHDQSKSNKILLNKH